jgi:hypothetical protein
VIRGPRADAPYGKVRRFLDAFLETGSNTPSTAGPPVELRALMTRIVGDSLVLEFESPEDGFELPERVDAIFGDAPGTTVTVDETRSSPRGPHSAGVVLRIALAPIAGLADAELRSLRIVLSERWVLVAPLDGADGDR